jgi:hypothetical protein
VIGIEMNGEVRNEARSRELANAEFRMGDVRSSPDLGVAVGGLWYSFTAAFIPDLLTAIATWINSLMPNGWIELAEIDDLLGHQPLIFKARALSTPMPTMRSLLGDTIYPWAAN